MTKEKKIGYKIIKKQIIKYHKFGGNEVDSGALELDKEKNGNVKYFLYKGHVVGANFDSSYKDGRVYMIAKMVGTMATKYNFWYWGTIAKSDLEEELIEKDARQMSPDMFTNVAQTILHNSLELKDGLFRNFR